MTLCNLINVQGYLLPVQYANLGISASHLHTRKHASIFDVSHMLQTYIRGKDAIDCFEKLCTADIHGLADNSGTLTVFTNVDGGILDDLIVTKVRPDLLYVVSNAARKVHDKALIQSAVDEYQRSKKDVAVEFLDPIERGENNRKRRRFFYRSRNPFVVIFISSDSCTRTRINESSTRTFECVV